MDETPGLQALDEVAQYLEFAELNNSSTNGEFGLGFRRRARASTISYSSSSYNDIGEQPADSLHQYLDDVGDDELEVANFLTSMSSQRRSDSWDANASESKPTFLIRTVEKVDPNNAIGGTLTNRNRPRSYSASEIPLYKHPGLVEDKIQLGGYSAVERRKRIERFLEKRKLRVWTKRVKYDVRKNLADSRVRVRGRFVKKEESNSSVGDSMGSA